MTLARVLASTLLLCSLPALAQVGQSRFLDQNHAKMFQNPSADLGLGQNALNQMRLGQFDFNQLKDDSSLHTFRLRQHDPVVILGPDGQLTDDTTCLYIRSYVFARDSKDSDSTHPVSYSTCQPASRYRVKTTEMRVVTVDR